MSGLNGRWWSTPGTITLGVAPLVESSAGAEGKCIIEIGGELGEVGAAGVF